MFRFPQFLFFFFGYPFRFSNNSSFSSSSLSLSSCKRMQWSSKLLCVCPEKKKSSKNDGDSRIFLRVTKSGVYLYVCVCVQDYAKSNQFINTRFFWTSFWKNTQQFFRRQQFKNTQFSDKCLFNRRKLKLNTTAQTQTEYQRNLWKTARIFQFLPDFDMAPAIFISVCVSTASGTN